MKKLSILLLSIHSFLYSQEPNYVRTTVYQQDGVASTAIVSTSYSDGLGRALQTQVRDNQVGVNETNPAFVTGAEYDNAGRVDKSIRMTRMNGVTGYRSDLLAAAKVFYNNDEYPYSKTLYSDDPLSRPIAIGAPGMEFSLDKTHHKKVWYLGTKREGNTNANFTADGFFSESSTDFETRLEKVQGGIDAITDPTHFLTVTKDENGCFSQIITDIFGKTVCSATSASSKTGIDIKSSYGYDILGNLLNETPPQDGQTPLIGMSYYYYNTLGQLDQKVTPDAGAVTYKYDDAGKLIQATDAKNTIIKFGYDELGRQIITYVDLGTQTDLKHKIATKTITIYDLKDNCLSFFPIHRPEILDQEFTNTKGRLVATISFTEKMESFISGIKEISNCPENHDYYNEEMVIDAFSYDEEGRVKTKYKSIPGLPLQTINYKYDLQGNVVEKTYNNGTVPVNTRYTYDDNGRLSEVGQDKSGRKLTALRYKYNLENQLNSKNYMQKSLLGSTILADVHYTYHPTRDWLSLITYTGIGTSTDCSVLKQSLSYETGATQSYYNGNISKNVVDQTNLSNIKNINTHSTNSQSMQYTYDNVSRLTDVVNESSTTHDDYDAHFDYDNAGRITSKSEGWQQNPWSTYNYKMGSNGKTSQLRSITGAGARDAVSHTSKDVYLYDANGNMIVDRSKNMVVFYDWRNLPIKFSFYNSLSALDNSFTVSSYTSPEDVASSFGISLLSYVKMTYDASGNRVLKQVYKVQQP